MTLAAPSVFAQAVPGQTPDQAMGPQVNFHNPGDIVVVELYSSRGCVFCPQADELFNEIVRTPNVIGIACHVNYFEAPRSGSMSRPFCTERQSWYMNALKAGPNYTPQMVFNGRADVVGYRTDDVSEALKAAAKDGVHPLKLEPQADGAFMVELPGADSMAAGPKERLSVFLLSETRQLPGLFGAWRGVTLTYSRIASALTTIDVDRATTRRLRVDLSPGPEHERIVALLQDGMDGRVLAAAAYPLPKREVAPESAFVTDTPPHQVPSPLQAVP